MTSGFGATALSQSYSCARRRTAYAPADRSLGFGPTRKALSRIAKEGRKYGVHLGLVTQRAGELDPTILSQCSTIFAMRMANEQDQRIIRSAVSEAAASLLGFVPVLGIREVLAFGEGVALPLRFIFDELPFECLPRSEAVQTVDVERSNLKGRDLVVSVVERWRNATLAQRRTSEGSDSELEPQGGVSTTALHAHVGALQGRQSEAVTVAPRTGFEPSVRGRPSAARDLVSGLRDGRM